MRLLVLSDLHLDHRANRERLASITSAANASGADALVIAGDVSHKMAQLEGCLRAFDAFPGPRLFVAGNHDIWIDAADGATDSWTKLERVCDAAEALGFVPLDRTNASVAGFDFVGSIGWYDYSFANESFAWTASDYERKQWRDFTHHDGRFAQWGMRDEEVASRLLAGVKTRLAAARRPVVFVSHHLPLEELVLRRGVPGWDYFNAFMGSRNLEATLRESGITRLVFGHSHRPVFDIAPGRWRINNPLGYPREQLSPRLAGVDVD